MKNKLLLGAALALLCAAGTANATVVATSAVGATTSPFALGYFGNSGTNGLVSTAPIALTNGTITFTPDNSNPRAGVYSGSVTNVATSAFTQTNITPRNYLVAEPNDPVVISFNSPQTSFSLLWGSVDTYNNLTLTLSGSTGTTTITGSDIRAQTNSTGPAFVTISNVNFSTVTLNSSTAAFEFDPSVVVPEPASLAVLSLGLIGVGVARRKKSNTAA